MIEVNSFSKSFGPMKALEEISFELPRGACLAIVGTNGSGKTTLIRGMLGLIEPDCGRALIDGVRYTPSHHIRVGYLPEERGSFQRDTPIDVLTFFGNLRGLDHERSRLWALEYLEYVGLGKYARMPIHKLSNGQQQKIHLGVTFSGRPDLLVLDEPTRGFDPINKELFVEITRDRISQGATLVLVSHQMQEVEALTDWMLFLKDSRIVESGSIEAVKASRGTRTFRFSYAGSCPDHLLGAPVIRSKEASEATVFGLDKSVSANVVLRALFDQEVEVSEFHEQLTSLDEVFVSIYGDMDHST